MTKFISTSPNSKTEGISKSSLSTESEEITEALEETDFNKYFMITRN